MAGFKSNSLDDARLAQNVWARYLNGLQRGHLNYQSKAKLAENFYLGGGRQWNDDMRNTLQDAGKPWLEENIIFSTVNTVLGYQTQSRMDIAYKPREALDQDVSDILTKLSMYVLNDQKYTWAESEVFADGIIQSRGYFDIRMDFDDNMFGNIKISTLDPMDVMPDPNAKSYDPDKWDDVVIAKWITLDEIKQTFGKKAYESVKQYYGNNGGSDRDWGDDGYEVQRNKFAEFYTFAAYYTDSTETQHVRLLERQYKQLELREFWYDTATGDFYPTPDGMNEREKKKVAKTNKYDIVKKLSQRVRWTVSTRDVVLHDDWSPYDTFTVVPYFPYFRRGVTVGLVDNLISTQEMLNKVFSQILHVVNTTANSGWMVEQNSLTNMDVEDLEDVGSQTGLVLEYKTGRKPPEKIQPNTIPTGLKDLVTTGIDLIRMISGVSETFQGGKGPEVSGAAIQSRVHQSAIQLASPIDNLYRTRNILACKLLKLIQQFYTEERMYVITSDSEDEEDEQLVINKKLSDDTYINDVTIGKYDVVVADVPTQITFQTAQFAQAIEMRKYGVQIPDDEIVKMSTLSRKNEIAKRMSGEDQAEKQQQMADLQFKKQIETMEAQINKLNSDATNKDAVSIKTSADVAALITANPGLAPIMDQLFKLAQQQEMSGDKQEEQQEGEQAAPPTQGLGQPQEVPQAGQLEQSSKDMVEPDTSQEAFK
jgi:hypothetical protein